VYLPGRRTFSRGTKPTSSFAFLCRETWPKTLTRGQQVASASSTSVRLHLYALLDARIQRLAWGRCPRLARRPRRNHIKLDVVSDCTFTKARVSSNHCNGSALINVPSADTPFFPMMTVEVAWRHSKTRTKIVRARCPRFGSAPRKGDDTLLGRIFQAGGSSVALSTHNEVFNCRSAPPSNHFGSASNGGAERQM
jgi:hypothetical protein